MQFHEDVRKYAKKDSHLLKKSGMENSTFLCNILMFSVREKENSDLIKSCLIVYFTRMFLDIFQFEIPKWKCFLELFTKYKSLMLCQFLLNMSIRLKTCLFCRTQSMIIRFWKRFCFSIFLFCFRDKICFWCISLLPHSLNFYSSLWARCY